MTDVIVIDVDNLSHRNWHALSRSGMFKNPVVYGFLRDMGNLAQILRTTDFAFCFDGDGYARRKLFAGYKTSRPDTEDRRAIRKAICRLRTEVLPALGYENVFWQKDAEADDVIGHLCKIKDEGDRYFVVSNDTDVYQLLSIPKVKVWSPIIKMEIGRDWVWEQYNVSPREWVLYKAITGCETDDVPKVRGIGQIIAARYLRGRLPEDSTLYTRIIESDELIERNVKLVTIPYQELLLPDWEPTLGYRVDPGRWNDVVDGLEMYPLAGKYPKS